MKLIPKRDQVLGRLLITKMKSNIVSPDPTKGVTKLILVLALGPGAEAEGYKVGDVVLPKTIGTMPLNGGTHHEHYCDVKDILFTVEDLDPKDVVASDGKTEIRSFDPADPSHRPHLGAPS